MDRFDGVEISKKIIANEIYHCRLRKLIAKMSCYRTSDEKLKRLR